METMIDPELLPLASMLVIVPVIVHHIRQAWEGEVHNGAWKRMPWPLVADVVAVLVALVAYFSGYAGPIENVGQAGLMALVLSFGAQRVYDASRVTRSSAVVVQSAIRDARARAGNAGAKEHRFDGVEPPGPNILETTYSEGGS